MNAPQTKEKGFTIIEVVLVLAIAALIFLMVFIALPALQRNQRDTARKNDASAVASALSEFRGNNKGKLPAATPTNTITTFRSQYLKDGLSQYDGQSATSVVIGTATTAPANDDVMVIVLGRKCSTTTPNAGALSSRAAAVWIKLEGGAGALQCTDA